MKDITLQVSQNELDIILAALYAREDSLELDLQEREEVGALAYCLDKDYNLMRS